MDNITILAIDIAKTVFQLCGINKNGKVVTTKRLVRLKLLDYITTHIPKCTIVMECCGGAHHWGRVFRELGYEVKLISPQYVVPYRKGNKTDKNDAQAIAEAASRPSMRFTGIKSIEQQDIQLIHRIRERHVKGKTALSNQIRGMLAEYGIVMKQGFTSLKATILNVLEAENEALSYLGKVELQAQYDEFLELEKRVKAYDKKLKTICKDNETCQRLLGISGVGPIIATAMLSLGDVSHMKNGRHFSSYLGLVPQEYSSGNKQRILGITKRGDGYIRRLLIQGAQAVIWRLGTKTDNKSQWLRQLLERRGPNRTAVALANKHARIIWKLLTSQDEYQPALASMPKAG